MPLGAAVARQAKAAWGASSAIRKHESERHYRLYGTRARRCHICTGIGLRGRLGLTDEVRMIVRSRGELPGLRKRKSFWRARRHAASLPIQLACRHTTSACV